MDLSIEQWGSTWFCQWGLPSLFLLGQGFGVWSAEAPCVASTAGGLLGKDHGRLGGQAHGSHEEAGGRFLCWEKKTWKLVLVSSDTGMMLNYLLYYIYTHVYINMDTFFVGRISYFSYFWPKKYYASFFPWFAILVSTLQKKQLQLQLSGHAHWKYRPDPPLDHQSILKIGFLWRTLNVPFWNTWKNP